MKKVLIIVGLFGYSVISNAQNGAFGYYEDALRFGQSDYGLGSTARMQAIGGAQISLGGDISSAVSNPAGLGFFNKSVFTVSPSLNFATAETDYFIDREGQGLQGAQDNFYNNFSLANIGAVINWNKGRFSSDPFKGGSLAISISRANNYRLNRSYEGINDFNSLADAVADQSFNIDPNNLNELAFAAFDQYLISPFDENGNLVYEADFAGFPVQNETIEERGSHYQMNIAWGGNYDDRFYFGGGMGMQFLNYRQNRVYQEFDFGTTANDQFIPDPRLSSFTLADDLDIRGTGINFNLGVIARPLPFVTIGASYTSPSFISFSEESFLDLDADWKAGATSLEGDDISNIEPYQGALLVSNYNLRTPSKVGLGATLFVGKSGFLSGDVEFVDYTNATINSNDFIAAGDNQAIDNIYASVMNVRVGGEYRIESFRLRAGYAFLPSPYQSSNLNEQTSLSFGFGYRTNDYFLDFALVRRDRTVQYVPYETFENQPVATTDIEDTVFTVTWGINF